MKCKVKKSDTRKFTDYIRARGLKHSEKRRVIAELFLKKDLHLNVDELHREIKKTNPDIGYSTVYRTLKLLVDAGLATERKFGEGNTRFEPVHPEEHHDHLICIKCGRIIEFGNNQIEKLQKKVGRKHNFRIMRHKLELYGYCDKCREREESMGRIDLTQMKGGEKGIVVDIHGGHGLLRRLESLGVRVGVSVQKVSAQFMRGPVTVRVGNTQVALGFGMARKVMVECKRVADE